MNDRIPRKELTILVFLMTAVFSPIFCSHYEAEFVSPVSIQQFYPTVYYYTAPPLSAVAELKGESVNGIITFYQPNPPDGPVYVRGNVTGLSKGRHGLHVHRDGDLREGCKSLGPYFNPFITPHGYPIIAARHIGDFGNIEAKDDGAAEVHIVDNIISLAGPLTVVGRGLVVHEKEDDPGKPQNDENSDVRLACGIIGYSYLL